MSMLELEEIRSDLEPFLQRLLQAARFNLKFQIEPATARDPETGTPAIVVNFSGQDTDLLLERGGELLAAIEHLAVKFLDLTPEERLWIAFDCDDYKSIRAEELRLTATTAAERVERTGQPFALNPMDARERRIVHLALRDRPSVRTESQGGGPFRKVVIFPAEKK
jgi:spoIIIJ-associated protein